MRSNYKILGDYIHRVDKRNTELDVTNLRGLSMAKEFRESTSNTIGTDMSNYKVMKKWQFACDFMSVIRVNKLPVVLKMDDEPNLVSPAYPVFEVNDVNQLAPEYLMMWLRRPEFDRYAVFKCDSAIRGGFDWDEFCNTTIPIPSITKQREIVKEYNVLQDRISLNNTLIEKLEDTAQAIYKQWFVDFDFPDENGNPYKSSGGEMMFSEELEIFIPISWEIKRLDELTEQICVAFVGSVYDYYCNEDQGIPMIRTTDITKNGVLLNDLKYVTREFHDKNRKSQLKKGYILVARHGSNGMPAIFNSNFEANCLNAIIIKPNDKIMGSKLIHSLLSSKSVIKHVQASLGGSVQDVLNTQKISEIKLAYPKNLNLASSVSIYLEKIENKIEIARNINRKIEELVSILLSKLATEEG